MIVFRYGSLALEYGVLIQGTVPGSESTNRKFRDERRGRGEGQKSHFAFRVGLWISDDGEFICGSKWSIRIDK